MLTHRGVLPMKVRRAWISENGPLSVVRQCELAGTNRSTFYVLSPAISPDAEEAELLDLIDKEYTRHPFFGSRKIKRRLVDLGYKINRKRVQRLMRKLGLAGMAPGPNTSEPHPQHKIYPYLLRGMHVTRPKQVWSTDITYCRLPQGFMYLVAIIDWYSRKVLAWRLSNTMESSFCVDCLEEAFRNYGVPEIFNSDQGSQFTSDAFIGALKKYPTLRISMDSRGRALDNVFVERLWCSVKHEDLYAKGYGSPAELQQGLTEYFVDYNTVRPHQSLDYSTPDEVYRSGQGGGAHIVDKYRLKNEPQEELNEQEGQRLSAA
ncbi:IS3 family transposase [Chlorobium phaeovibrioides]|uniref:IS3 family transposase n=1 Tax=Chlorobium phaeovibrioides TaxID=1094 RepID=A0A5M8I9Z9_CHLPH|nr:IS3 family transposase [Chlorobium phaeovibrioides]